MPDCPLTDDCPRFEERIAGMGCAHYGDRGGMEWCQNYDQPISDLKTQPVKPGEEVVVDVTDIHESGAGVGRTEDGFIVMVDGILPDARAKVKITKVHSNHARADPIERLPMEEEDEDDGAESSGRGRSDRGRDGRSSRRDRLGSRENFWGK
ncbi:TRAM domain-containing protein [Haloarchaeobius sp. DFWS5]|uniref:TRAM domain-containing protein n=1 Tax=Haloarchaeobius sp. DFWS5 TaxID=3446114 RepID=UPI003EBE6E8B